MVEDDRTRDLGSEPDSNRRECDMPKLLAVRKLYDLNVYTETVVGPWLGLREYKRTKIFID